MSELKDMIREAFLGEEAFDSGSGRANLEAALTQLGAQERTLRILSWTAVGLMTLLAAWAAWRFAVAGSEATTKALILYAVLFLFAMQAIGTMKLSLFILQKDLTVLRELKRMQLRQLDG